jgi:Ca2+-binding EF-hand superfamily protein
LKVFKKIDSKEVGKVTFDEIFQYFESPSSIYAKEIFVVMDAVDTEGKVQFGDFVRACGAFCLYGKVEVLK